MENRKKKLTKSSRCVSSRCCRCCCRCRSLPLNSYMVFVSTVVITNKTKKTYLGLETCRVSSPSPAAALPCCCSRRTRRGEVVVVGRVKVAEMVAVLVVG